MKTFIIAAAAALLTAPAFAAGVPAGSLAAIAHFNSDATSQDQYVTVTEGAGAGISTRNGASPVQDKFNADFTSQDDIRKTSGATLVSGTPGNAAAIFARIQAESASGE